MKGPILHSEGDTARLARVLAATLRFGEVVGLRGDLGAGKTTLVRWLVDALEGAGEQVASPSYTLQNEYVLPCGRTVEHWDLYRLRELPDELSEPPGDDTLRIIEWPERAPGLDRQLSLVVDITAAESGQREIRFSGPLGDQVEKVAREEFLKG